MSYSVQDHEIVQIPDLDRISINTAKSWRQTPEVTNSFIELFCRYGRLEGLKRL